MLATVLLWVSAVGGAGTLLTVLAVSFQIGFWKGHIDTAVAEMQDNIIKLNESVVYADTCEARGHAVEGRLSRLERYANGGLK